MQWSACLFSSSVRVRTCRADLGNQVHWMDYDAHVVTPQVRVYMSGETVQEKHML